MFLIHAYVLPTSALIHVHKLTSVTKFWSLKMINNIKNEKDTKEVQNL